VADIFYAGEGVLARERHLSTVQKKKQELC